MKRFRPSPRMRLNLMRARYLPGDTLDRLRRPRGEQRVPRWGNAFVGGGDAVAIGNQFLRQFIDLGGLTRNDDVLDLGCGIGRVAIPLTKFLDKDSVYYGIDIVDDLVVWCRNNITARYPNFTFSAINVLNREYNMSRVLDSSPVGIPLGDESVDFVIATSLFTHLLEEEHAIYVREIQRVLRAGGALFATYFLTNTEVDKMIDVEGFPFSFPYRMGKCRVSSLDVPETAVAYHEDYIVETYASAGLSTKQGLHFGTWPGRQSDINGQDVVVARKPA